MLNIKKVPYNATLFLAVSLAINFPIYNTFTSISHIWIIFNVVGFILFIYYTLIKGRGVNFNIFSFLTSLNLIIFFVSLIFFVREHSLVPLSLLASMSFGFLIFRLLSTKPAIILVSAYICIFPLIVTIFVFIASEMPPDFWFDRSRNHINMVLYPLWVLLFYTTTNLVINSNNSISKKIVIVVFALFSLSISFVLFFYTGRLGVISSLIVGFVAISFILMSFKHKKIKFVVVPFLICLSFLISTSVGTTNSIGIQNFQFRGSPLEDVRFEIWIKYLESLSFMNWIIGFNPNAQIQSIGHSFHSSLFQAISFYGIYGLIYMLFIVLIPIYICLRFKNWNLLLILLNMVLIMALDSGNFFSGIHGVIYFFLFFQSIFSYRKRVSRVNRSATRVAKDFQGHHGQFSPIIQTRNL